jgi:branched-chain amino acid transport system ATP-binding protein
VTAPVALDAPLTIESLTVGYRDLIVLRDVDLHVDHGEVLAVVGPNGAGKSTLLKAVAGILTPSAGQIRLLGSTGHRSVHRLVRAGVGYVPSERGLFASLSVRENIRVRTADRDAMGRAAELFPKLGELTDRRVGLLSGGEQQMLAIAAVLVTRPKVLLLDEMSMGLAPTIVRSLLPAIRAAAERDGVSVLLVEQHAPAAVEVADRVVVLSGGRIVHEAPAADVRDAPEQLAGYYLGSGPSD